MTAPIGLATFPGIQQIISASYTLSHGISPSVCTMEIAPQAGLLAKDGPLVFTFANVRLVFPDARIDDMSYRRNDQGLVWALQIFDRRWKWQFGAISGVYNQRNEDGTLRTATEKTPQQLAALLLTAMGERRYQLGELPNDTRPEVNWAYDNPAQALAQLAETLGCRIILQLDDTVRIARAGVGQQLPAPASTVMDDSGSLDLPERPDRITFVAGQTRVEMCMLLEAVGLDTDDKIKPIADLTYKPAAGWSVGCIVQGPPGGFPSVSNTDVTNAMGAVRNPRKLAQETVYRWYRIKQPHDTTAATKLRQLLRNDWEFRRIDQFLPIEPRLLRTDASTGRNLAPLVYGVARLFTGANALNSAINTKFTRPFTIDTQKGIVKFSDYVYKWNPGGAGSTVQEAELYLFATFPLNHQSTRAPHRLTSDYVFGGARSNTGPRIVKVEEIGQTITVEYKADGTIDKLTTNQANVLKDAAYYLGVTAAEYETRTPRDVSYAGLLPISPDGAIQQVTWSVGQSGATTRASRDNEYSFHVPPYKERRMLERLRNDRIGEVQRQIRAANQAAQNAQGGGP